MMKPSEMNTVVFVYFLILEFKEGWVSINTAVSSVTAALPLAGSSYQRQHQQKTEVLW